MTARLAELLEAKDLARVRFDALMKEHEHVYKSIDLMLGQNEKALGFGITLLGLAAAYGINQKVAELLFFLPIASFGLVAFLLLNMTAASALGGYNRALTEELNRELRRPTFLWDADVAPRLAERGPALLLVMAVGFLTEIGASYVGVAYTSAWYSQGAAYLLGAVLATLFLVALAALLRAFAVHDRAYTARLSADRNHGALDSSVPRATPADLPGVDC